MAIQSHTTTDAPASPLPAPLPSLKDAFAVRRQIFGAVPSAASRMEKTGVCRTPVLPMIFSPREPGEEQPDFITAVMRGGATPHALGGWTLGAIVVATVALEWLARAI